MTLAVVSTLSPERSDNDGPQPVLWVTLLVADCGCKNQAVANRPQPAMVRAATRLDLCPNPVTSLMTMILTTALTASQSRSGRCPPRVHGSALPRRQGLPKPGPEGSSDGIRAVAMSLAFLTLRLVTDISRGVTLGPTRSTSCHFRGAFDWWLRRLLPRATVRFHHEQEECLDGGLAGGRCPRSDARYDAPGEGGWAGKGNGLLLCCSAPVQWACLPRYGHQPAFASTAGTTTMRAGCCGTLMPRDHSSGPRWLSGPSVSLPPEVTLMWPTAWPVLCASSTVRETRPSWPATDSPVTPVTADRPR